MNAEECASIILESLRVNGIGDFLLVALLALFICTSVRNGNKKEGELDSRFIVAASSITIVVIITLYLSTAVPAFKDIKEQSYICTHGEYYMYNYNYSANHDRYIQVTTDDGEVVGLVLPSLDPDAFPAGKCQGTVWYAENSRYILKFIPDEGCKVIR